MNRFMKRFRLVFVFALLVQLVTFPLQSQAAETQSAGPTWVKPVNYLALGDSLAFGITYEGLPGEGYPDYLAQSLNEMNVLASSNKGFAYPGYTTPDVLKDLNDNVSKPSVGINQTGEIMSLHEAIQNADVITLSAGANDMLKHFKIDPATGTPQFDEAQIMAAVQQVGMNTHQILNSILELNPHAHIYVMGYYNPFPSLAAEYQPKIAGLLAGLNGAIQSGMQGTAAVFVPTSEKIATNFAEYVPNPQNIHLSEAGYKVIAGEFSEKLNATYSWIPEDALTAVYTGDTTATLTWKPAADTKGIKNYMIYANGEQIGQVGGDMRTFNVTELNPAMDYEFMVKAVNEDNQLSEMSPAAALTKTTPEPPNPIIFKDIQKHWAKTYIEKAVGAGIVAGYSDGTFRPDQILTRVQANSIIVRTLGLKSDHTAPFTDISGFSTAIQAEIGAAHQFGIIKGVDGKFKPNDPVTRAQLAVMLKRTYEAVSGKPYVAKSSAPYKDISGFGTEVQHSVSFLHEHGIVNGSNGKYLPNDGTTRGQAAKILVNYSMLLR